MVDTDNNVCCFLLILLCFVQALLGQSVHTTILVCGAQSSHCKIHAQLNSCIACRLSLACSMTFPALRRKKQEPHFPRIYFHRIRDIPVFLWFICKLASHACRTAAILAWGFPNCSLQNSFLTYRDQFCKGSFMRGWVLFNSSMCQHFFFGKRVV